LKRIVAVLFGLLAFGVLKTPAEHHLLEEQRASGFQLAQVNNNTRAQLGQMGFVAALSGFRAVMADLLWIRAGNAFEATDWNRLEMFLHSATQLQPRAIIFWEMSHYHMAYDAAIAVKGDEQRQPNQALRRRAEREFHQIGEGFLLRGIGFNPESARLYECLGNLYKNRMQDHLKASQSYAMSAQRAAAMGYVRRFAVFELAKVPGMESEAYEQLKELYLEGPHQRVPTLLTLLKEMEQKLAVPEDLRVHSPENP
jgi:hypothetical protein